MHLTRLYNFNFYCELLKSNTISFDTHSDVAVVTGFFNFAIFFVNFTLSILNNLSSKIFIHVHFIALFLLMYDTTLREEKTSIIPSKVGYMN